MFARLFAGLTAITTIALLTITPAHAQQNPNDIGGIIEDIFGNGRLPAPGQGGQYPNQKFPGATLIDNIPVEVHFDARSNPLPEDAMLVVTAYAPPPPNVRRAYSKMLGETRLLLAGLQAPLQIIVAAPGQVTESLDYARIEARIEDHNGTALYKAVDSSEYRGAAPAVIKLVSAQSSQVMRFPDENLVMRETVKGRAEVSKPQNIMRGAFLVVRLVEENLAGGRSVHIVGDTRVPLDGKTAPYDFSLERVVNSKSAGAPLAFDAWIEDWAGRRSHTLQGLQSFSGARLNYELKLLTTVEAGDSMPDPHGMAPTKVPSPAPAPMIPTTVEGEARFNAFKGLPSGSVLIAELERMDVTSRPATIAVQRIKLDGMSGNIPFTLNASRADITGNGRAPVLRIRIEDASGKLFFSNPGGTQAAQGFNAVNLRASPNY